MIIKFTINKQKISSNTVYFAFEKEMKFNSPDHDKILKQIISNKEFEAGAGEVFSYPLMDGKKLERLILVGLGEKENFTQHTLGKAIGNLVKSLEKKKITQIDLDWPEGAASKYKNREQIMAMLVKYFNLANYKFIAYQSKGKEASFIKEINFINLPASDKLKKVIAEMEVIGQAINYTRDLVNHPSNKITPQYFADEAADLAKKHKNLEVKILSQTEMIKQGMGGLLGVSAGSQHKPQFIILEYLNGKKGAKPKVFVGKTITFDSGGISLKPGDNMDEMKMDMAGGGSVLGAFKAICELGLKVNVIGLIPACENMPSGKAYKPGDILLAANHKTIEVLNTDAEGRIILADALSYAQKYKPEFVIDLATLTGACLVALGTLRAGLFGNNQALINQIDKAGIEIDELVWPMPLDNEYSDLIKSKIADVRNIATTRYGGAITGAAFLKEFVNYPWSHLDIAGVAWSDGSKSWLNHGSSGFGVNLILKLLK
ncbi:MAG: leucyl aminopeptidase [Candidatus Parcubacteria bacterium]|nr:leucyl aminopeptidase [Candidatus Parcubacteria bacterium]